MFPLVDVLVYYVSESGEIVSDDLRVRFENKAQYKVSFDSFIFSISFLFVMKIITITLNINTLALEFENLYASGHTKCQNPEFYK